MGSYVVVVFVRPVQPGFMFPRTHWPLHITLARFDTKEPADVVSRSLQTAFAGHAGFAAGVGAEDFFGRTRSVPVSLLDPDPRLQLLHDSLLDALGENTHVLSPHQTRENFRPHISHQAEGRVHPGDVVRVSQTALVDMRPDGDSKHRRVIEVWELGRRFPD